MNALQRLIRERCAEQGWTYADVARRGDMPTQTVQTLAAREVLRQTPRPATLENLARGLELPLPVVQRAAAEAAGFFLERIIVTDESGEPLEVVLGLVDDLTPEQRAQVEQHILELRERARDEVERARRDLGGETPR